MPRYHNINGEIVQFTAEEEAARDAEEQAWEDGALARAQTRLRLERNRRLAECDWVVTKATELGKTVSEKWIGYRQTLRHLPENASPKLNSIGQLDLTSVNWPTKPS